VPTSAQAQGPHTYAISFTPRDATVHTVDLRFNGEDVPGNFSHSLLVERVALLLSDNQNSLLTQIYIALLHFR